MSTVGGEPPATSLGYSSCDSLACSEVTGSFGALAQAQINSTSRLESFALRCTTVYSGSGILPTRLIWFPSLRATSNN
jgi:hypothetical protein